MKLKIRSNNGVPETATAHYARVPYEARIAFAWGLVAGAARFSISQRKLKSPRTQQARRS